MHTKNSKAEFLLQGILRMIRPLVVDSRFRGNDTSKGNDTSEGNDKLPLLDGVIPAKESV